ncbi:OmpA family protein [Beggiatoa leptomitoformis]|uniref:OmpA family protein n=1 Tax=Beggiatoa leptomitoformis TaxID=288004 RepID=A0A2N9YFV6_9GAMM|nr:OmpA family protein [Beggiatoa leptomitoformis]AUI69382.1 OmpA family protein [Beggiatoa leptomitoformis]QGX03719.1 OmpA family protein [Beggiatoa leptomitoformis]
MLINTHALLKKMALCVMVCSLLNACSTVSEQDAQQPEVSPDNTSNTTDETASAALDSVRSQQTAKGLLLTLSDGLFETGKAELLSTSAISIDKIASYLHQNPSRNVLIEGHTDNTGSHDYNLGLSQRRADAVKYALISRGIASKRIVAKGIGEVRPITDNKTQSGRRQNRRIEITVLNEGLAVR